MADRRFLVKISFNKLLGIVICGLCYSCEHKNNNALYLRVGGQVVDNSEILLIHNKKTEIKEVGIKNKEYRKNLILNSINENSNVYFKINKKDTSIVVNHKNRSIFISISYSKWHNRFIVMHHDSSSFWKYSAGSNDAI